MHMKIRIILVLLLFITPQLYAQDANLEQLFQSELLQKNENVTSIKCEFSQTREVAILANKISKKGVFYFAMPNNMLLKFDDGDYIKMSSEWFEIKMASNITTTKVTANPMLRNLSAILSACVVGDIGKISRGFAVDYKCSSKEWTITLTPQQGKAASKISRIIITFDKSDMSLNLLKMEEKSGDYTAYNFTNKQFNTAIDSQLFNVSK